MRARAIAAVVLGGLSGCAADSGSVVQQGAAPGAQNAPTMQAEDAPLAGGRATEKTGAPVEITTAPGPTGAQVAITFRADAADVSISVWGADGLEIEGNRLPVAGRSFRSGDRLSLTVNYAPPRAAATLAMQVSGTFGSRRLSTVRSFTVGEGSAPAQSGAAGELSTDSRGRPIRVMRPQ